MVASDSKSPEAEEASSTGPNQEPRHVDELNHHGSDATSTTTTARTTATPTETSMALPPTTTAAQTSTFEKPAEAGVMCDEKPARGGSLDAAACSARHSVHAGFDADVNAPDFQGEVLSNDELPSPETIGKVQDYVVLDRYGKTHAFKSLYTGRSVARRVLIIFVRHFLCGNCQEYLRSLSDSITPQSLLQLPIPTFIAVVGCGDPHLIDMYTGETGCPFPIYADPTRRLYQELGMIKTLALGEQPAYMRKSIFRSSLDSIVQGVKQIKSGLVLKAGNLGQVGGEFLFEPVDLRSPKLESPKVERPVQEMDGKLGLEGAKRSEAVNPGRPMHVASATATDNDEVEEPVLVEEKKVTWCHRMRNTRDHAEIPELMEVLGLTGQGKPIKDQKRWSKAVETRKGGGLSLAGQMSQVSQHKVDERR